jgi:hypothetical protein
MDDESPLVSFRLPDHLFAWLHKKRADLSKQGLDVSLAKIVRQQLERAKHLDDKEPDPGPKGPKKARPSP